MVAFFWFMALIRRRLGKRGDQFFATVFLGSGFAFGLPTIVAAVCVAAPILVVQFGDLHSLDDSTVALAHGLGFVLGALRGITGAFAGPLDFLFRHGSQR